MKNFISTCIIFTTICLCAFKSDNICESYFVSEKGATSEITNYDASDKMISKSVSTVTDVKESDGGIEATVHTEVSDKNSKPTTSGNVTFKCTGDKFYMDMSGMMPNENSDKMKDMTVEMDNQYMEFPSNPTAGEKLPDASSKMTMKMNGTAVMTMTINVTDRIIEKEEMVTTTAGTFKCIKYSSTSTVTSKMFTKSSKSNMWLAKNTGMVKSETYDDTGKLQYYMLLTAFTK
jgi:hypothetical protein